MMRHSMLYNSKTNEWVGGSKLTLSTHTFTNEFNPVEELRNAFANIKKGDKLTFRQEYAIESLWHEILHAKTQTKPMILNQLQIKSMETVNQFIARHTYHKFIERLGGRAFNQEEVLENGYGYKSWIADFRKFLKEKNISEQKAVEFLTPHLMSDYTTLESKIRELFKQEENP